MTDSRHARHDGGLIDFGGNGMGRRLAVAFAGSLVLAGLSWSTGRAEAPPGGGGDDGGLSVYTGVVDSAALSRINGFGVDRHELEIAPVEGAEGQFSVEVILSDGQAAELAASGADLTAKDASSRIAIQQEGVFRRYSGEGGIQEELIAQAAAYPAIAESRTIGQTTNGQDITAVRVTRNPGRTRLGRRPTTVYVAAQHAREWITPEMVRRLLDYYLTGYGSDPQITSIIDNNELWFIPVANPDGYDYTHDAERLWRKNLRDNNGDGQITAGDGVDLNRNFPTRWGYDNEGSSPNFGSETYRGPGPMSEPEDQALDALFARDHARVLHQLPLGCRAAAVRPRLAGLHAVTRRRALRGDGRQRRHRLGDPRLRPGHLRRAVHDERRHRLPHAGGVRHARVHAGDVDVRDRRRRSTTTTSSSPRTARAASTSPTTSA